MRVLGCLAITAAVAGCGAASSTGRADDLVGSTWFPPGHRPTAPPVSGVTLTGAHLRLADYRGSVAVVNFWASWCEICRAEAPALARLWHRYQASGIRFLGVDINDTQARATAFDRRFGIGYPSLNDPSARLELAFRGVLPPAIPDTLVLDRTGRIAGRVIGKVTYPGLSRLIGQAIREPS